MRSVCRVCEKHAKTYRIVARVSRNGVAREWVLSVCRDCWRVFEVQLDSGSTYIQHGLSEHGGKAPTWLL